MIKKLLYCTILIALSVVSYSQEATLNASKHSPKKAVMLSAILPGAGQIYNKKAWKAPVFWTGLGVSTYFIIDNSKQYKDFKVEYENRLRDENDIGSGFEIYTSADQVKLERDRYEQWRNWSIISFAGFYLLNVVDAMVDGHLYNFDVSDDLSLGFKPLHLERNLHGSSFASGISLTFFID